MRCASACFDGILAHFRRVNLTQYILCEIIPILSVYDVQVSGGGIHQGSRERVDRPNTSKTKVTCQNFSASKNAYRQKFSQNKKALYANGRKSSQHFGKTP